VTVPSSSDRANNQNHVFCWKLIRLIDDEGIELRLEIDKRFITEASSLVYDIIYMTSSHITRRIHSFSQVRLTKACGMRATVLVSLLVEMPIVPILCPSAGELVSISFLGSDQEKTKTGPAQAKVFPKPDAGFQTKTSLTKSL
jgi:hypothetical protein